VNLVIVGMIFAILLFPASFAQGFEWNSLLIWEESEFISVAIISDFDIDDKTVQIIKEVIESEKQDNGEFFGWNQALLFISEKTNTNIPLLKLTDDIGESSITIELSKSEGPKNMDGFTQYEIIDKKINKATVIIYDYDMLKQEQLELVVRHELGHALGLGHTYNSLDLMFPALDSKYSLISMFDLETLSEIYVKT
jgi:predicted Zn-dependent protease